MSKNFKKFRKKVRAEAILSSLLFGLASGAIAYAALAIAFKLSGKVLPPFYYGVVGGIALLVSLILYFILTPSDKRLAKKLDAVYSLDEKVSTMVELRDSDNGFARLQREDADERLGEKPIRALKSRQLIAGLLVFFIALGSLAGALVIPAKADGGEEPIDAFDKEWIIAAIGELITIVEGSPISEDLKTSTLSDLNSLLTFVEGSELLSEMKREAVKAVISINRSLYSANSAEVIAKHFAESENKVIADLGKVMSELSGSASKKSLIALGEAISGADKDSASFIADELNAYIQASGVRSSDEISLIFKSLIAVAKTNHTQADEEFESAGSALSNAIIIQNVNKSTVSIVINKLCNLFGITEQDITDVDPDTDIDIGTSGDGGDDYDPDVEDPDVNIGTGGIGTGDVIYGSNDLIYDPYTNTYRPYGEVINEYFARANEQITDGKTSEDIADAAEEYFGTLFAGTGNDN